MGGERAEEDLRIEPDAENEEVFGLDPCVARGTTIADDVPAHAEVVKAIKEFLVASLQPKQPGVDDDAQQRARIARSTRTARSVP